MQAFLWSIFCALAVGQPIVRSPYNETYFVGNTMTISWDNFEVETSEINIDLINVWDEKAAYELPFEIAHGVDVKAKSYSWVIPSWVPSMSHYQLVLWGRNRESEAKFVSKEEDCNDNDVLSDRVHKGTSVLFTIVNHVKNTVKTLTLTNPTPKDVLHPGKKAFIRWDYPYNRVPYLGYVRVYACKPNEKEECICRKSDLISNLGTINLSLKFVEWNIPADLKDYEGMRFLVSVTSDFDPNLEPELASDLATNSAILTMQKPPPGFELPAPPTPAIPEKSEPTKKSIDSNKLIRDLNVGGGQLNDQDGDSGAAFIEYSVVISLFIMFIIHNIY